MTRISKKAKILASLMAISVIPMMAGCGGNASSQVSSQTAASTPVSENSSVKENSEAAAANATYTIKLANVSNPDDNCVIAFYQFKQMVEEKTGGDVAVEVYHSGQLGAQRDYFEGMQMGSIQAAEINTAVLSAFDPKFMVFDLPYSSKSVADLQSKLDSGIGQDLSDSLEEKSGVKIIGWMIRSPRILYNSLRPVVTADDFAGMKIRIMESPVMSRTFELLGAVPVPLAASERYMALQTGVVDGAENSIGIIRAEKEYEVTKYVSLTEHFITPNVIAISSKYLESLPEDYRQIILDSAKEAAAYATELDEASVQTAISQLKSLGMEINECPDKSSFIGKVSPLYEDYRDEIGGDIIDAFLK
ncbi:MAG: TRAP transporter substrate-binding protein [Ruminococcaceae bacterium]|nr:TRAP transporter substrate-binding protein [Oscillospiraceae bacterium]